MKKKKVGIVASSVAAIAVCTSVIAGSTYALFTSESKVNIAVTSGKVNLTATVKELGASSTLGDGKALGAFSSVNGVVGINNIAPGDVFEFTVGVANASTVKTQYRTSIALDNALLASALEVSVGEKTTESETATYSETYSGLTKYMTEWAPLEAEENPANEIAVKVAFPNSNEDQNKYQGQEMNISVVVEGVQANAGSFDNSDRELIYSVANATQFNNIVKNGGKVLAVADIASAEIIDLGNGAAINLNGHGLSCTGYGSYVNVSGNATIENGVLNSSVCINSTLEETATVTLDRVEIAKVSSKTDPDSLFQGGVEVRGNAKVTLNSCKITAKSGTNNPSGIYIPEQNDNVENIEIEVVSSDISGSIAGIYALDADKITVRDSNVSSTPNRSAAGINVRRKTGKTVDLIVENGKVESNKNAAIYVENGGFVNVTNVELIGKSNNTYQGSCGLQIRKAQKANVIGCTINASRDGIYLTNCGTGNIRDCNITTGTGPNNAAGAIWLENGTSAEVSGCTITSGAYGVIIHGDSSLTNNYEWGGEAIISDVTVKNCTITAGYIGLHTEFASHILVENCDIIKDDGTSGLDIERSTEDIVFKNCNVEAQESIYIEDGAITIDGGSYKGLFNDLTANSIITVVCGEFSGTGLEAEAFKGLIAQGGTLTIEGEKFKVEKT